MSSYLPTLRLLCSSLLIGMSGGLRIFIGFLLIGVEPIIPVCYAMFLTTYSTYTFDRVVKTREDEFNRKDEVGACKPPVFFVIFITTLMAMAILIKYGISPAAAILPFSVGFLYTKGIKFKGMSFRLKQGFGIKNLIVAFTWSLTIVAFIYPYAPGLWILFLVFAFFFLKSFICTVICDCRDLEGDTIACLNTIPVYMGEIWTRRFLQFLHSLVHMGLLALILLRFARFETVILLYSWGAGILYINHFANRKKSVFRGLAIHGEWVYIIILRDLLFQLSRIAIYNI